MIPPVIFDLHYWILSFVYPIVNLLFVFIGLYAFAHTKYSMQFLLITASAALSVFISTMILFFKVQKALHVAYISNEIMRFLWPFQAIAEYLSLVFYTVGIIWLVVSISKTQQDAE